MHFFSVHGEKREREIRRSVDSIYEEFWLPCLQLIKLGYLTYTEAKNINQDDLYELWTAVNKLEESFSKEVK